MYGVAVKNHVLEYNGEDNGYGISLSLKSVLNIYFDPNFVLAIIHVAERKKQKRWENIRPKY